MSDVIIVGAGLGGLMAAAKLAARGRSVLLLDKKMLPGGTSCIFQRSCESFACWAGESFSSAEMAALPFTSSITAPRYGSGDF